MLDYLTLDFLIIKKETSGLTNTNRNALFELVLANSEWTTMLRTQVCVYIHPLSYHNSDDTKFQISDHTDLEYNT